MMLIVYVDDFKLAGPRENVSKARGLIRNKAPDGSPGEKSNIMPFFWAANMI